MKISLNWLNSYIDLSGISVEEIAEKISTAGLEVEEITDLSSAYDKMVVGFVKEHKNHPNAEKLSVCVVTDGGEDFNVVCGAPNVAKGQKVAFAKVGAVIPSSGLKLEKVKIRGEVSQGMICSEKELGISDNHEGILVLDSALEIGKPLAEALGLNDVVMEIAITPNRADALSHIGIARDLAAIFDRPLKYPAIDLEEAEAKSSQLAEVEILDAANCPRYIGKVVCNVEVKESPEWLKNKLKNIGLRPINNVVDVTNFVLYEVGQPLHAFDLDRLAGKKIVVKRALEGEKFVTLDSKERVLSSSDLMICDAEKSVAIAGVMGGENSEVTAATKNLLIESAFFNPSSIRKTAKRLGLSTDASYRFERGADYNITVWAARRAAELIKLTAGGDVAAGEIDAFPNQPEIRKTLLRLDRLNKILGYTIPPPEVTRILTALGFGITSESDGTVELIIPTYRLDIEREIDVIEEIARIYGYDKIPEVHKISVTLEEKVDNSAFADNLRDALTSLGYFEIMTNSLLGESTATLFGNPIGVLNPQTSEMSHLRTSLLPGMLVAVSNNLKVNERNLQFFEIGNVFNRIHAGEINSFDDFEEKSSIIMALSGKAVENEWYGEDRNYDLYDLKGDLSALIEKISGGNSAEYLSVKRDNLFDLKFEIKLNGFLLGTGGRIDKELLALFDVNQDIFAAVLDIEMLKKIEPSERKFKELLKFPKIYRDVAFIVEKEIESDRVIGIMKQNSSKLLHRIKLFDIFQSDSLGKDKKSLAFQLEFYDAARTLTDDEIEKDFRKIIAAVESGLNAKLRGI